MVNEEKLKRALSCFLWGIGILVLNFIMQKYEGINLGFIVLIGIILVLASLYLLIVGLAQESHIVEENHKIKYTSDFYNVRAKK